jgi:hypothetical protein
VAVDDSLGDIEYYGNRKKRPRSKFIRFHDSFSTAKKVAFPRSWGRQLTVEPELRPTSTLLGCLSRGNDLCDAALE